MDRVEVINMAKELGWGVDINDPQGRRLIRDLVSLAQWAYAKGVLAERELNRATSYRAYMGR